MRLCGICHKQVETDEFCKECNERRQSMKEQINDRLAKKRNPNKRPCVARHITFNAKEGTMKQYSNGITKKNRLLQFFCKHKNIGSFREESKFQSISGETHHHICKDCGKKIGKQYLRYEGMGFK